MKRKTKTRKIQPVKPIKIAALIITAIQNLREMKGSSSNKIVDYITFASDLPQRRIKPKVNAALKTGLEYGILKRFRGQYFLATGDDLDRADRIAARFAKLPASVPSCTTCDTENSNRYPIKKSLKARSPTMNLAHRPFTNFKNNLRKARSMPLSLTSMITEKSYHRNNEESSYFESDVD